jgi:hypothetical protein
VPCCLTACTAITHCTHCGALAIDLELTPPSLALNPELEIFGVFAPLLACHFSLGPKHTNYILNSSNRIKTAYRYLQQQLHPLILPLSHTFNSELPYCYPTTCPLLRRNSARLLLWGVDLLVCLLLLVLESSTGRLLILILAFRQILPHRPIRRRPLRRELLPHNRKHFQQDHPLQRPRLRDRDYRHGGPGMWITLSVRARLVCSLFRWFAPSLGEDKLC